MARAYAYASQAMSISLAMLAPGFVGIAIDLWLGTTPLLMLIGVGVGFVYGIWRLSRFRVTSATTKTQSDAETPDPPKEERASPH